jgi:hypothetical protein
MTATMKSTTATPMMAKAIWMAGFMAAPARAG